MGKVRLADVAKAAGVSQGTASNVFNQPHLVRPEVRERVKACAEELGYNGPDPKGRLLRAGKVHAIGVVAAVPLSYFFDDPYANRFMVGISDICDREGAGISLVSAVNNDAAAWSIQTALVDGFVLYCLDSGASLLEATERRGLPFVAVDIDASIPGINHVRVDDRHGAYLAAKHLVDLGHRRVGILSMELGSNVIGGLVEWERLQDIKYLSTSDRLNGYFQALSEVGIETRRVPVVEVPDARAAVRQAVDALLAHDPGLTAILSMTDVFAFEAMKYLREKGISVPRDISIVGYDDIPAAEFSNPPLTTINQPIIEKGRLAADMVLRKAVAEQVTLPVSLVIRGSTAAPRS